MERNPPPPHCQAPSTLKKRRFFMGRGILLWLLGVPIPVIILILLFWH